MLSYNALPFLYEIKTATSRAPELDFPVVTAYLVHLILTSRAVHLLPPSYPVLPFQ